MEKVCSQCKKSKSMALFGVITGRTTRRARCNPCLAENQRLRGAKNPAKKKEIYDRWRRNNPESYERAMISHSLRSKYGITLEQYETMLKAQGGVCAICGGTNFRRLGLDHCHRTKRVRGLLCDSCNLMLGHSKDSIETLRRAIAYLEARILPA